MPGVEALTYTSRISVFLGVHNGLPFLRDTIKDLLSQTESPTRLVILDDQSTDGSPEYIESLNDPRVLVERSARLNGIPANWNRALASAQTPFFALAHQDDRYHPEFLATQLDLLDARPRAFMAHSKVRVIDENGATMRSPAERYKAHFWPRGEHYERGGQAELSALLLGNYIAMPTVVYRTDAIRRIGLFDTRYKFAADWHYWIRGVLAGHTVVGTARNLVDYRRHATMETRRFEADLSRFQEELEIGRWVWKQAQCRGFRVGPGSPSLPLENILLSAVADRLVGRKQTEARRVLQFGLDRIPAFRGSLRHLIGAAAIMAGPWGGRLLTVARYAAILMARTRRRGFTRASAPTRTPSAPSERTR